MPRGLTRRELFELVVDAAFVISAALAHFLGAPAVATFVVAALAIAALARLVGGATEQLGARIGASGAGAAQSALGNLPEFFIALFALHQGLVGVVQAALVGSVLANSLLVLGIAFAFHAPAAAHGRALSFVCAGVLLAVFVLTLPGLLRGLGGEEHAVARWPLSTTVGLLLFAGVSAALASDWFVSALRPAIHTLHMSEDFAGLVIVAIAGNAVENVVGVQLAVRNRPDFAIAVIINSSLQVALALTPVLVFASLAFATTLTLVFPTLLALSLLVAAAIGALVVYDGESTWTEGVVLIGLYVVLAASFWWGA